MHEQPTSSFDGVAPDEVDLASWGKALLEEVLFRAATRVTTGAVAVRVDLTLVVDADAEVVRATLIRAADPPIVTSVVPPVTGVGAGSD
ncbi:hypothetical protein [Georgenia sp. SYP-B2076]|uniref:hypothetical protein n=1 Tax=Georgenia sp. SYP-B2076 TaxID=2495881 RepID=UPI000F8DDD62|nr:hypothetical protein [Georgenia sp. SYP-B2076]